MMPACRSWPSLGLQVQGALILGPNAAIAVGVDACTRGMKTSLFNELALLVAYWDRP